MMRNINFYTVICTHQKTTLYNVSMSFLSSGCDNMCQSVFKQKSLAVKLVKDSFELYVNSLSCLVILRFYGFIFVMDIFTCMFVLFYLYISVCLSVCWLSTWTNKRVHLPPGAPPALWPQVGYIVAAILAETERLENTRSTLARLLNRVRVYYCGALSPYFVAIIYIIVQLLQNKLEHFIFTYESVQLPADPHRLTSWTRDVSVGL